MARLPVLMYHDIAENRSEGLTISTSNLEEQFRYLSENNYNCWFFSELNELDRLPRGKHVVITFDDAYVSQMKFAEPLLKKYGLKATIFVPLKFVGGKDDWNTGEIDVMDWDQLKSLDKDVIELGCHSYGHINYKNSSLKEVEADLREAKMQMADAWVDFSKVLAYPYGKFPKRGSSKWDFYLLLDLNYRFACRIGNRVNSFPFNNNYEVQRLDIKGDYSLKKFKRKLKYGKLI